MRYRQLAHTGVEVSEIGFGCWTVGTTWWGDRPESEACYIMSGEAVITDHDAGAKYTVTAGDVVVFPKGFNGRWDVTRTIRKFYAVY